MYMYPPTHGVLLLCSFLTYSRGAAAFNVQLHVHIIIIIVRIRRVLLCEAPLPPVFSYLSIILLTSVIHLR